jgi:hypothetical protein
VAELVDALGLAENLAELVDDVLEPDERPALVVPSPDDEGLRQYGTRWSIQVNPSLGTEIAGCTAKLKTRVADFAVSHMA